MGEAKEDTSDPGGFNLTTISDGPNTGYAYFATQLAISTLFQYEINPDLENSSSNFSVHQCGNYNATTNPSGFVPWSDLLTQTKRHEFNSSTQSHHAFYANSISAAANNPGDFFERQVAVPGTNLQDFRDNVVRNGLNSRYNLIFTDTKVEPFAVNESEAGIFLGNINYAPYTACP